VILFILSSVLILMTMGKIPVIIDTDIGSDIDDTWALAYLLLRDDIDVKLVVTETHNTWERTKYLAKYLDTVKRTDVPIGIGPQFDNKTGPKFGPMYGWSADYNLSKYSGVIHLDGIAAMVDVIQKSPTPVVILEISPSPNIQHALKLDPTIVKKSKIFGMGGSFFIGYNGYPPPVAEYNIVDHIPGAKALFEAKWLSYDNVPLDVSSWSQFSGENFKKLLRSKKLITQTLMDNNKYWFDNCAWAFNRSGLVPPNPLLGTSSLHDLVSAVMITNYSYWRMEQYYTKVNDTGFTLVSKEHNGGQKINHAIFWKDLYGWIDHVVNVLY